MLLQAKYEKKVLFADSTITFGGIFADFLRGKGYRVVHCKDGIEAWDKYKDKLDFPICIIDPDVKYLNGFSLCQRIKEANPETLVIFYCKPTTLDDVEKAYKFGADDYIHIPYDFNILQFKLDAMYKRIAYEVETPFEREEQTIYIMGDYTLDCNRGLLTYKDKETISIGGLMTDIIKMFWIHRNVGFYKNDLLNKIWGSSTYNVSRSFDVQMVAIKKHFKRDKNFNFITRRTGGRLSIDAESTLLELEYKGDETYNKNKK